MAPAGGGNIKVVVRVRPFNGRELDRRAKCVVQMKDAQTILIPPPDAEERLRGAGKGGKGEGHKTFAFDRSYWSFDQNDAHFAGQDNLFADLGRPLLDNAFQGYNNCIFAYGQTGSGKSYSMMGYRAEAGVIPRICQDMFERITEIQKDPNLNCTVEVSYLEIYNERVRDLLNPSTKGNLKVREHPSTGPYVEDLAKLVVRSFQEIENLMDEGNKARTVAATNMNETSSRSHAVFTLTLTQKRHDVETRMDTEKVAKISLVDLAGSERATSTGATGARLKEGAEINRSLSTLGRVIASLADISSGKKKNMSMVPYRDSVLTWLLKDSLGGNSMTAMIAAISPADINFEETLSTLRYADSAKRIKNHAVVNEDPNARMIRELKEELAQLRSKLSGGGTGPDAEQEIYAPDTPLEKQFVSITAADGTLKKVSKADIAEQLNQSEKLYQEVNQTWEQKLQRTEEIHKEREAALEELGISIEKGFVGLHTPKKMPHLVNLSDDPLLAECLVYNLKPGTTTVGNVDTATTSEIRLNGTKILHDHCTFENVEGVVTVVPKEGAAVMVNGLRVDKPKRLRSGYRIILGDFHIFRFNHPQEARAERAEQSLLRHSITASQLGSPAPRMNGHAHSRSESRAESEYGGDSSRPDSPAPLQRSSRDSDWSFARREAAHAILGPDQKVSHLTDDELDSLLEEVQQVRAVRKARPESRMDTEDDTDSMTSFPMREKYTSAGTIDNFSLDTAITLPSTPQQSEAEDQLRIVREEMQSRLDKQREEYLERLRVAESGNVEIEEIRAEKERMETNLRATKAEMQSQLEAQREEFKAMLEELGMSPRKDNSRPSELAASEIDIARAFAERWRQRRFVRMAEEILQYAAVLKEAQVMSREMAKIVSFQFAIVDVGHTFASSYDLVLSGVSEEDDEPLVSDRKPCVGVRVMDFKHGVIYLWSLKKLQSRVRSMHQLHQYVDRPEYLQHFRLGNPFSETCLPQYSLIADADVPLTAVFECRVQDFTVEVVSPYTSGVIGIVKLSLEPSTAQAPSSTLKFNVVMREMVGFAEREGTDVHAQLFIPGISEEGGATTTQMIGDFDESAIRFESVHSMSLPESSAPDSKLRVSIFARVTTMHLDKLLSWDDIKDSTQPARRKSKGSRLAETEFRTEERHDVFARVQISELSESGDYHPVEVVQSSDLDAGVYQLRQGLQRRLVLNLTHSSGEVMQWRDVAGLRIGHVQLINPSGKMPDVSPPTQEIPLKPISEPTTKDDDANGTSNVTLIAQWDSSLHDSLLLDRTTTDKYRVQVTLLWDVASTRLISPVTLSLPLSLQILPRSSARSTSKLLQLWTWTRIVHSTIGNFSLTIRPTSAKRVTDLWRMDTQHDYVKGEEQLAGTWAPRGVSLVYDFLAAQKRRKRIAELESARGPLSSHALSSRPTLGGTSTPPSESEDDGELTDHQRQLLTKCTSLWTAYPDPTPTILAPKHTSPPLNGAAFAPSPSPSSSPAPAPSLLSATVHLIPKSPTLLKAGYLLTPSPPSPHRTSTTTTTTTTPSSPAPPKPTPRWTRRYVELRRPYLHIHSVPDGDELFAINLTRSRIDTDPRHVMGRVLTAPAPSSRSGSQATSAASAGGGKAHVFAVYAERNTWVFAARGAREKAEWVWAVDQVYFGAEGGSPGSASGSEAESS
ncbi:MAG: kinesin-like protein Klp8 [Piccolia ochrophora]|nr:MAG: kinesin-like protein Klp8 [Piccolia ochrophora]